MLGGLNGILGVQGLDIGDRWQRLGGVVMFMKFRLK